MPSELQVLYKLDKQQQQQQPYPIPVTVTVTEAREQTEFKEIAVFFVYC